jgi:2'-5' RNA ligase
VPQAEAPDTAGWEEWQIAYRFGVLLILPPDPLRSIANELRTRYDPRSQSYCDAHISLTVPAPRAITAAEWTELERAASMVAPFSIRYGPIKTFLPNPGVTLAIEPQDRLDALRTSLEAVAPFSAAPERTQPFMAHLTIARNVDAERTQQIVEELGPARITGRFTCSRVTHVVPDASFRFAEHGQLRLGH